MRRLFAAVILAAFFMPGIADAQAACGLRSHLIDKLERSYAETPRSMGLASNGSVIEIFVSPKGSWTITMIQPGSVTCLMAVGENWEDLPPPKPKDEES